MVRFNHRDKIKNAGVVSVSVEGESRDQIVVTGDRIDSVCLTRKLRKKFSYATLLSVADESASNSNEGGETGGEKKDETITTVDFENSLVACCYANNYPPPCPSYYVVYDPYVNTCSIL